MIPFKFFRFGLIGIMSYSLILLTTIILTDYCKLHYALSYVIALLMSMLVNYFLATDFIFKTKERSKIIFIKYFVAWILFYFLNIIGVIVLTELFKLNYKISVASFSLLSSIVKYFVYNKMVFKEQKESGRVTRELELHKKLAAYYENIREGTQTGRYYSLFWFSTLLNLVDNNKTVNSILDVGCGTGIAHEITRKKFPKANYVGIDLSPEMISIGKRRNTNLDLRIMNCENIKLKENTFDLVIVRSILHHTPNPEQATSEISRVLKPNGIVLISEPNKTVFSSVIRFLLKKLTGHFDEHHTHFSHREIEDMCNKAGLIIKSKGFFGYTAYPFGFPDIIPLFKWIPIELLKSLCQIDEKMKDIKVINKQGFHIMVTASKE